MKTKPNGPTNPPATINVAGRRMSYIWGDMNKALAAAGFNNEAQVQFWGRVAKDVCPSLYQFYISVHRTAGIGVVRVHGLEIDNPCLIELAAVDVPDHGKLWDVAKVLTDAFGC